MVTSNVKKEHDQGLRGRERHRRRVDMSGTFARPSFGVGRTPSLVTSVRAAFSSDGAVGPSRGDGVAPAVVESPSDDDVPSKAAGLRRASVAPGSQPATAESLRSASTLSSEPPSSSSSGALDGRLRIYSVGGRFGNCERASPRNLLLGGVFRNFRCRQA